MTSIATWNQGAAQLSQITVRTRFDAYAIAANTATSRVHALPRTLAVEWEDGDRNYYLMKSSAGNVIL